MSQDTDSWPRRGFGCIGNSTSNGHSIFRVGETDSLCICGCFRFVAKDNIAVLQSHLELVLEKLHQELSPKVHHELLLAVRVRLDVLGNRQQSVRTLRDGEEET